MNKFVIGELIFELIRVQAQCLFIVN